MPFVMLTSLPVDAAMTPSQALVVFALRIAGAGFVLWLLSVAIELVRAVSSPESSPSEASAFARSAAPASTAASTATPAWQPAPAAAAHAPQAFAPQAFAAPGLDERTLAAIAVALELESLGAGTGAPEASVGLSPWAQAGRARQMRKR